MCELLLRCGLAATVSEAARAAKDDPRQDEEHVAVLERLAGAASALSQRIADVAASAASRGVDAAFEAYRREVLSGVLGGDGGAGVAPPPGTDVPYGRFDPRFWRIHAPSTMEEEDFSVVRVLLRLLDPSASSSVPTLRLACHDLGQFAMHHPHGRSVLRQLECYGAVAQLLAHADDGVRRSALLCTQKIMLSRDARDRLAAATSTV